MSTDFDDRLFNDDIEQMRINGIYTDVTGQLFMPNEVGETASEPVPNQEIQSIFDEAQNGHSGIDAYEGLNKLGVRGGKPRSQDRNRGFTTYNR